MNRERFLELERKYFEGQSTLLEEEAYFEAIAYQDNVDGWKKRYSQGLTELRNQHLPKRTELYLRKAIKEQKPRKKFAAFIWTSGIAASLLLASLLPYQLNMKEVEIGTALVLNNTHSEAEMLLAKAYLEESLFKVSSGLSDGYKKVYDTGTSETE